MVKPTFAHDCTECAFLGKLPEGTDLYVCNAHGGTALVERFGDEGQDYGCGPYTLGNGELSDRGQRAEAAGLI